MFENNKLLRATVGSLLFTTLASALFLGMPAVKAGSDVVDRVSVIVPASCSMSSSLTTNHIAEINNGQTTSEIGTTNITAFCNDNSGYAIYAIGYTDNQYGNNVLESSSLDKKYDIKTSNTIDAATSSWAMKLTAVSGTYTPIIAGSNADAEQGDPDFSDYQSVPEEYTKVAYYPVATEVGSLATGSSFTTTYRAHISPTQPAGTYIGQVKYTLVHPNGDFPFPEDTLVGTTLRFNEHIDVESLADVVGGGNWSCNSLNFTVKITPTIVLDYLGIQNPNITTWSQLADALPNILTSIGATDVQSNMKVLDNNQSYSYVGYRGLCPWWYDDDPFNMYYHVNDNVEWLYLPASTGSISFTLGEEIWGEEQSFTYNSFRDLIVGGVSGAWLTEQYYYDSWNEEFFRTISIYGGNDATNQALIQWLSNNAILLYTEDSPASREWTFNEAVLSESSMYWDVGGMIYSNQYTAYHFDSIDTNTDYGVPIWSFYYYQVTEPYTIWDGFIYLSEDLNIPEQGINYGAGWYFGNAQNPTGYTRVSPPTITLEDGEDLYNPAFTAWLHQNANAN